MIDQYGIERELTPIEREELSRDFIRTAKQMIINIAFNDERFNQNKADEWLDKKDSY